MKSKETRKLQNDMNTSKSNKPAFNAAFILSIMFVAISLESCIGKSDNKNEEQQTKTVEQVYSESNASGQSQTINEVFGTNKDSHIKIELPAKDSEALTNNIMEWINESMGGTYTGPLDNTEQMTNYYKNIILKNIKESDELSEMTGSYETVDIQKIYEDDLVVTYICKSESYFSGAAHGAHKNIGQTFRKSDGKSFSCNYIDFQMLRNDIKEGLKKYLNASNDEELFGRLFEVDSVDEIPVPESNPWITKDGVTFIYQSYEIASYSDGTPTVTIAKDKVRKALNATGKTFMK